jgi:uncharacterized protein (TIGR00730 family)
MDNSKRVLCVFCGSSHGSDAAYASAARRLGTLIGENGFNLVFGGGYVGLMGEVAHAARIAGASVTGVLPEFLRWLEPPAEHEEKVVLTPDMHERKKLMIATADAFVVLPGGLGTLDELFEVLTSAQLGQLSKPIVLLNIAGFFAHLENLIHQIVREQFARADILALYRLADTPEEALQFVSERLRRPARA